MTDCAVISFPHAHESRLRVALRQLDAALEEQRQAVAAFQRELANLSGALNHLVTTASGLHDSLTYASEETLRTRNAAVTLTITADHMDRIAGATRPT